MGTLSELWIITRYGLPVYHQSLTGKFDETLFAGFISAILHFVKELGESDIRRLELGESKIVVLSSIDKKWFFIGKSDKDIKDKKIHEYLNDIQEIFFEQFGDTLEDWNNDLEIFKILDTTIDIKNPESPSTQEYHEKQKSRGSFL
ncbi:MAG: hypothetical protein ACFFD2_04285 [Promethearchaeota archaeon]